MILKTLQEDARITNADLADSVGLSPAPCLRRVRALEQQGVIRKYVTLLDPGAVNLGVDGLRPDLARSAGRGSAGEVRARDHAAS